jgi:hypothetical protein
LIEVFQSSIKLILFLLLTQAGEEGKTIQELAVLLEEDRLFVLILAVDFLLVDQIHWPKIDGVILKVDFKQIPIELAVLALPIFLW